MGNKLSSSSSYFLSSIYQLYLTSSSLSSFISNLLSYLPSLYQLVLSWSILEFFFYIYYRMRLRTLQHYTIPPPLLQNHSQRSILYHVYETMSITKCGDGNGIKEFICNWCCIDDFNLLKLGNIKEFLSWSLFSRYPGGLNNDELNELTYLTDLLSKHCNLKIPEGYNKDIKSIRLSLDPVNSIHRPLFVYIFLYIITNCADFYLLALGFKRNAVGTLRYWYRPSSHTKNEKKESNQTEFTGKDSIDGTVNDTWNDFFNKEFKQPTSIYFEKSTPQDDHVYSWPSSSFSEQDHSTCNSLESTLVGPTDDELIARIKAHNHTRSFSSSSDADMLDLSLRNYSTSKLSTPVKKCDMPHSVPPPLNIPITYPELAEIEKESNTPIIFFHGVGVGLVGYIPLLLSLEASTRSRPLFLVEMPYVSMRLWESIPTPFETADLVCAMLQRYSFEKATFVGHSFGSISVAWVLKMRPNIVSSAVLIDPVSLLLCWPKVAYNFLYKPFSWNPMELIIKFCATEMNMARVMYRHFWWYLNTLWYRELPDNCTVILSANDSLVPSARIKNHLKLYSPGTRVMWMPDLDHAMFLLYPNVIKKISSVIAKSF